MLKTKEDIIEWLRSMEIKNYTIRDDLTVDIEGSINLSHKSLTELPIQFGIVSENFYCSNNKLVSLEGCPKKVGKDFFCYDNKLISLKGSPEKVGGNFYCFINKLMSLEGTPQKVVGDFDCSFNELNSLEGSPQKVGGDFYCYNNKLTSLKGMRQEIVDKITFSPIKDIDYLDEYKNKDGHIEINFNVLNKIMKSHELKEKLENTLNPNPEKSSKKFKI